LRGDPGRTAALSRDRGAAAVPGRVLIQIVVRDNII